MTWLILRRRVGETILIGKDVRVTVNRTERGAAYLGIEAPREIKILREELEEFDDDGGDAAGSPETGEPEHAG